MTFLVGFDFSVGVFASPGMVVVGSVPASPSSSAGPRSVVVNDRLGLVPLPLALVSPFDPVLSLGGDEGVSKNGLEGCGGRSGCSGNEGSRPAQSMAVRRVWVSARGKGTTPYSVS